MGQQAAITPVGLRGPEISPVGTGWSPVEAQLGLPQGLSRTEPRAPLGHHLLGYHHLWRRIRASQQCPRPNSRDLRVGHSPAVPRWRGRLQTDQRKRLERAQQTKGLLGTASWGQHWLREQAGGDGLTEPSPLARFTERPSPGAACWMSDMCPFHVPSVPLLSPLRGGACQAEAVTSA